jgi:hypothetical protein
VPAPLPAHLLTATAAAAKDDPALRVVVALAGVHALLPGQVRHLRLDQVDLPGRRLDPGGLDRPLDEFTATAIRGYLDYRDQRWPATSNPYLLVTRKTAHTSEPVSRFWMNRLFRGLPVTAEQLRDDRIIEEAVSGRADPLHLAAVFGFGPRTGLRYASAARETGRGGSDDTPRWRSVLSLRLSRYPGHRRRRHRPRPGSGFRWRARVHAVSAANGSAATVMLPRG